MSKYTIREITNILRDPRIKLYSDFPKEIKTKFLGEGCFREAHRILDTNLVVKFPQVLDCTSREHGRKEMRHIKRALRFSSLRRYVPVIYYFNHKTTVTLMRFYSPVPNDDYYSGVCDCLGPLYTDIFHPRGGDDIGQSNCGLDTNGNVKILDWGI